jgi:1-deoxy-D-xylulose-5-phosphate reductoisomerase
MAVRKIVVLGSTGSIGTQTLDIIERLGQERASVVGLVAWRDSELLKEQARRWGLPSERVVAVEREGSEAMTRLAVSRPKKYSWRRGSW